MKRLCYILLALLAIGQSNAHAQVARDSLTVETRKIDLGDIIEWNPIWIVDAVERPPGLRMEFDAEQLRLHANEPLANLLEESPAVFVKSYGPSGSATPAFRGTGAAHTQVYWNGLPINSSMLGLTDLSLGTTGMFDGVSLVFGPSASHCGDGGLGGAVLLENNWPSQDQKISVGQEFASFGNLRSNVAVGLRKGAWSSTTKVNYMQGRNDFTFQNTSEAGHPRDTLEHSGLRQLGLFQEVGLKLNEKHQLSARVWLNGMDRELPPTMLTHNLTESQSDRSLRSMLSWKLFDFRDWTATAQAAYFSEQIHYQNSQAGIDSDSRIQQLFWDGTVGKEWSRKWSHTAGLRLNHSKAVSNGYSEPVSLSNATAFANLRYHPSDKLHFSLLLRETLQGDEWSLPSAVVEGKWNFDPKRQTLAFNAGHNSRFPSFNDLFWQPGGNPDLQAEQSWSAEVSLQETFPLLEGKLQFDGNLSTYVNKVEDMIQWLPGTGSFWTAENVHSVLIRGLESSLSIAKRYGKWHWRLSANHAWTRSENLGSGQTGDHSAGKQLIYVPMHTGMLRLRIERGGWSLNCSQHFTGMRYTTRDNSESLPAFSLGNVRLSKRWIGKRMDVELYAGLGNVWNTAYQSIPWRPMPGRNYLGGIRFELKK